MLVGRRLRSRCWSLRTRRGGSRQSAAQTEAVGLVGGIKVLHHRRTTLRRALRSVRGVKVGVELRKEHGWSQADLASRIGGDAGQISRYENGRITPSADVIVRLAEVFDVTTDYLLLEDAPRRPQRTPDEAALGNDRIAAVTELSADDLALVTSFIDALVTKTRLKVLAGGS